MKEIESAIPIMGTMLFKDGSNDELTLYVNSKKEYYLHERSEKESKKNKRKKNIVYEKVIKLTNKEAQNLMKFHNFNIENIDMVI